MNICRRKLVSGLSASFLSMSTLSYAIKESSDYNPKKSVRIIGHRGCSSKKPDNSIDGIKCAIDSGANGVEIDVRPTKDNKLVMSHDPHIVQDNDIKIIQNEKWGSLNNYNDSSDKLVLFEDALDLLSKQKDFDIHVDLKFNGIQKDVTDKLEKYNLINNSIIQSWNISDFEPIKDVNVRKALLTYYPSTNIIDKAVKNDIYAVIPHYTSQNLKHYMEYANSKGIKSGYWVLNDTRSDIIQGIKTEPDFIITNRPYDAVKYINSNIY